MKNITITLDEKVARWARIRAVEEDTSVFAWWVICCEKKCSMRKIIS